MTREEAIELLNDLIILIKDDQGRDMATKALGRDYDRALHMAIEALKEEKK